MLLSSRHWFMALLACCGVTLATGEAAAQGCFLNAPNGPPQFPGLAMVAPNQQFDGFVKFHLGPMCERFRVKPRFYYFDDFQGPNAFSYPGIIGPLPDFPPEMNAFGTVVIGRRLIDTEAFELRRDEPPYPILGILAHELGHTVQIQQNFPYPPGVARELHADFMSGWFMRYVKERHDPGLKEAKVFASFYGKGDNQHFFDPNHHGTSVQRLDAFLAGFNLGSDRVDVAYNAGLGHVRQRLNLP